MNLMSSHIFQTLQSTQTQALDEFNELSSVTFLNSTWIHTFLKYFKITVNVDSSASQI